MNDELEKAIAHFDGKDISQLQSAATAVVAEAAAVDRLISYCLSGGNAEPQGASWVLKYWREKGWVFTLSQSKKLIEALIAADNWQLRLHILQILSGLVIGKGQCEALYYHLRHGLSDDNKFVRAWSYSGLAELAKQHLGYRNEVLQLFELAEKDNNEAASVKARIRNIEL